MRNPYIFIFASALFFAVVLGVINELIKINFANIFLPLILGIQTYAKYGAVKKYGIYVALISLICLLIPYIIQYIIEIKSRYSPGDTNFAIDITKLVHFLPFILLSIISGFLLSQGFLIRKLFNSTGNTNGQN
jgi:hypothetical protein